MKKYENPELVFSNFALKEDVLTASVDFDKVETGGDKDDTIEPF